MQPTRWLIVLAKKVCTRASPRPGHIPSVFLVRNYRCWKKGSNDKHNHRYNIDYCTCSFVVSRIYDVLAVLHTLSQQTTLLLIVWIRIYLLEEDVETEGSVNDPKNAGETHDNDRVVVDNPLRNARFFVKLQNWNLMVLTKVYGACLNDVVPVDVCCRGGRR